MFVLSDSNAKRAYGTSRGFQLRACNAASSADACSSVSLQVWMVSGFTARKINRKGTQRTQSFCMFGKSFYPHPCPLPSDGRGRIVSRRPTNQATGLAGRSNNKTEDADGCPLSRRTGEGQGEDKL